MIVTKKIKHFLTEDISRLSTKVQSYRKKRWNRLINRSIRNGDAIISKTTMQGEVVDKFIFDDMYIICCKYNFGIVFWIYRLGKIIPFERKKLRFIGTVQKINKETKKIYDTPKFDSFHSIFHDEYFKNKDLEVYVQLTYGDIINK